MQHQADAYGIFPNQDEAADEAAQKIAALPRPGRQASTRALVEQFRLQQTEPPWVHRGPVGSNSCKPRPAASASCDDLVDVHRGRHAGRSANRAMCSENAQNVEASVVRFKNADFQAGDRTLRRTTSKKAYDAQKDEYQQPESGARCSTSASPSTTRRKKLTEQANAWTR